MRFTFTPSDFWYIPASDFVTIPKIVIIIPMIVNIRPIGILISTIFISSYQNIIVKTIAITPTSIASPAGRSYQGR